MTNNCVRPAADRMFLLNIKRGQPGLAARCILTRRAAVDSKHTELAVKGTEYSPAEPGLAVPCQVGYRTVGNTVDSTDEIKKRRSVVRKIR